MADDTGLGYNDSALVIALVLAVVAVLYFFTGVSPHAAVLGRFHLDASVGSHDRQFF
jgi:uncharacterized membrane-anchored protein